MNLSHVAHRGALELLHHARMSKGPALVRRDVRAAGGESDECCSGEEGENLERVHFADMGTMVRDGPGAWSVFLSRLNRRQTLVKIA